MAPKEMARLLAGRNEPSVLEKEELFAGIAKTLDPVRTRRRTLALSIGALASLLGAAAAFMLYFRVPRTADEFTSRGSSAALPMVRLACISEAKEIPCALEGTLTFEVAQLPTGARFFAAFSRRPDGVILWYYPTPDGRSEAIDATRPLLPQAVRLGPPHIAGDYDVFTVFSPNAMTRAELKAALGPKLEAKGGILLVKRHMRLRDRS